MWSMRVISSALRQCAVSPSTAAAARWAPPVVLAQRDYGSNRAKRGVYAGKDVRFGNTISHSHRKTRRKFKPNVHSKRLWSPTLECWLKFNMTTSALRCIDRVGTIDDYLLQTPEKKLGSISGSNAKRLIQRAARRKAWDPTADDEAALERASHHGPWDKDGFAYEDDAEPPPEFAALLAPAIASQS